MISAACFDDNLTDTIRDENRLFRAHTVNFPLPGQSTGSYTDNNDGTVTDNTTGLLWTKCTLADEGKISADTACSTDDPDFPGVDTRLAPAQFNWWDAKELCESLELADKKWKLPTQPELFSLVMFHSSAPAYEAGFFPAFDDLAFPDMQYNSTGRDAHALVTNEIGWTFYMEDILYWSASLQKNNNTSKTHAFYIDFFNGFSNNRSIEINPLFLVYETNFVRCISR